MTFTLIVPAFAPGALIPKQFTCEGKDLSPTLQWSDIPANTGSFALIVDDPDAPGGTFTHWVLFDIPGDRSSLAEGDKAIGLAGQNDFGSANYRGPCPPRGHGKHHYTFSLYALDCATLKLKAGTSRRNVEAALRGHVLAQSQYMGYYERK